MRCYVTTHSTIQSQHTKWRGPISIEKKVVVMTYKLIQSTHVWVNCLQARIGKFVVHNILMLIIPTILHILGHVISWPNGRMLIQVTMESQSTQGLSNCIDAFDENTSCIELLVIQSLPLINGTERKFDPCCCKKI